jgi:hypothetical protein
VTNWLEDAGIKRRTAKEAGMLRSQSNVATRRANLMQSSHVSCGIESKATSLFLNPWATTQQ